jgi:hypothetical protein
MAKTLQSPIRELYETCGRALIEYFVIQNLLDRLRIGRLGLGSFPAMSHARIIAHLSRIANLYKNL